MYPLSTIAHMPRSPIRRIYERAIQMEDVVFFSLGEPDFDTPRQVVEEAVRSLRQGETRPTPACLRRVRPSPKICLKTTASPTIPPRKSA